MVGCVAGSVENVELPGPQRNPLATIHSTKILRWNGKKLTKQALQIFSIQARSTVEELAGIHHVGRAAFVHVNDEPRVFSDEGPRGGSVIEMNMGQENSIQIRDAKALALELSP